MLHDAGASDGKESGREHFSVFRLVSEADLPPLDCGADSTLSGVVGRFYALIIQKGEQMVPVFEESSGSTCHIGIGGQFVALEAPVHACSDGDRLFDKALPVHVPVVEGVPEGEHAADFREHPFCEAYAIRAPAGMFEPSEGSDNVGPADLPCPLVVCVVSREHVRADDTAKDLAKDPFEDFCTSGGCQGEESHGRGHENPKPDPLAHAFPPRLVHVENLLFGKSLFDFLTAWFKGLGYFLVKFAHRAKGDINPEEGLGKLLTSSSGHPMHGGEVGKESSKSGTEAGSSLGWDIRPGDGAAGTFDTTKLVFGDVRFDLGNLYHLAAKVIAEHTATIHTGVKRFVTNLTRLGKDLLDQINLLCGNQIPVCPLVTRLPSRLAMPGFLAPSHFWFACRTVGRRWLGGIGRILGEKGYFSLQFSHFLCKKIHCTAQLQQDLHDHFSVAVRNGYGFFPSHGESQYQDQPPWQEEIEKRRDMARLQISSNDQKGLTQAKPGGRLTPPGERLPLCIHLHHFSRAA